uniref:legumain n=1 Tax=Angiostrongylus costaricensis TaxID=334426 RepID=A0A158PJ10_ANGCS
LRDVHDAELSARPQGTLYALLVAGSSGWWNYRHQANVAHAYQMLVKKGVPTENIIVMMYDDVASNPQNPFPGKLFNRPNGEDVHAGLVVDYAGDSVTSRNFINVLQGNSQNVTGGTGRVIVSQSTDRIFVYFADHGGAGVLGFPNDLLTKGALNRALQQMYYNKLYGQLVFYLESCESGSMFEGTLWKTLNIYAMTATNPYEQSFATYCDNHMGLPCLGDLFSVNWMDDSERVQFRHNIDLESLLMQYEDVKRQTNETHVMRYGSLKFICEPVSWFEGKDEEPTPTPFSLRNCYSEARYPGASWPARDIELMHLQELQKTTNNMVVSEALKQKITKIHEDRRNIEDLFNRLVSNILPNANHRKEMIEGREPLDDMKCHNDVVKAFDSICIDLNKFDYALKYVYVLNNLCVRGDSVKPANFLNLLKGNAQNVTGGSGRVINSTANDRIFVYFTDHGADGIVCFPDDVLSQDDLNMALNEMYDEKRYYQLACEIYAMTAANPYESSWGTYCDNDMNLPCLGDLFSVNWMQNSKERNAVKDPKCHNDMVKAFDTICIDVNKYIYMLNNLCTKIGVSEKIINAMHTTCSSAGKQYL